jgi:RimJ/RimL family protein N-acetyltransferase
MTAARIVLQTERLLLRTWLDSDRHLFREINADPKVMEFFPFRRGYAEADALLPKLNQMIEDDGFGLYCVELRDEAEPIGFCGLSFANMPNIFPPEAVEIGWRLATRYWGNGYATEAAASVLNHAFCEKQLEAVLSFAVADNVRSTAVMRRIGMHRVAAMDFDHPRVPDTHPHLKPHVVFAAIKDTWKAPQTTAACSRERRL